MRIPSFLAAPVFILFAIPPAPGPVWTISKCQVTFVSDAPMERIEASTRTAKGALDLGQRTFAVRIPVRSFEGFNSPLQREHFNENYMESERWPDTVFSGRLIEVVDLSVPGRHNVRAKGVLDLHGQKQERIITCVIAVAAEGIRATADFEVLLADHGISIPGMVRQKIATEVHITVDMLFTPEGSSR